MYDTRFAATLAPLGDAAIFDLLPSAICVCDASGALVRYNRHAVALWGHAPRPGDPPRKYSGFRRLLRPDGQPLTGPDTPMAQAIRTGQSYRDLELRAEPVSGPAIWISVNVDPIRDERGAIVGAISTFHDITARKQTEQTLHDNERLLTSIIDTTPECVKIVAGDGTLLRINPAGLAMLDAAANAEVEGSSIFPLIAPDHRAHWREQHERVRQGERRRWEFDLISLRGKRRHMETLATPLTLPDGTVAQLAITRDLSRQKQDEAALRASEWRFRELLEALPVAIYTTDPEGRITFFNRAAAEFAGHEPRLGTDRWCVTHRLFRPDGSPLPHEQCPMAVALRERRPIRGEQAVAERPDGTRVPFLPYPTPLFDPDGNLVGAINMLLDVSDRMRAREYSERLAAIVESSDDAIVSKDTNGIIMTWNQGARRLFGYDAEEVIGKPINILIPPDRQHEEPRILSRIRRGEHVGHYETVRIRKDGALLDISLTVSPVKDANGKVVGAAKIARDITERKRDEARRQLLVNELNHRVKNTLATVQSIAARTFRGADPEQAVKQFEGRLIALSRAHDVLTRESWEGANMAELVREVMSPICSDPDRVEVSGPPLRLRPKMALVFSMALHELCTNAMKYGALTNTAGRVQITWTVSSAASGQRLRLVWREIGGPTVAAPTRHGFGTQLLERALARELGAHVRLTFPPSGALFEVEAPLT